jgi:hypothetical protein
MIKSARLLLESGQPPAEIDDTSLVKLRSLEMILPRGADWLDAGKEWMLGRSKVPPPEAGLVAKPPPRSATDPLRDTALVIKTPLAIKAEIENR